MRHGSFAVTSSATMLTWLKSVDGNMIVIGQSALGGAEDPGHGVVITADMELFIPTADLKP